MSMREGLPGESKRVDYCNLAAQALGLAPAGHGRQFDDAVLLETPLPWRRDIYEKAGALPQELIDLLALWLAQYRQGRPYTHCPLLIAPDPAYAQPGMRRVIFFSRPPGAFARYTRTEYLAPEAEAGPLIWALHEAREELGRFKEFLVADAPVVDETVRDILVCTHGTVDVACSKFGYPLYAHLRQKCAGDNVRVWRVSHFGGHLFAPTMLELPAGSYWAYVGAAQGEQIVERCGDVAQLRGLYRGWAGAADGFAQVAEGEAWQQEGWPWFDYARACTVTAVDEHAAPQWANVRVDFVRPDDEQRAYMARIEARAPITTRTDTAYTTTYAYPQYGIADWHGL